MTVLIKQDLDRSRLDTDDLYARPLGLPERSALDIHFNIQGFVIPYFDINGNLTSHYRARLFDTTVKYKQPKGSDNAVYFPRTFQKTLNGHNYVIITEGEKKAAAACKGGFPCVGLGGVYSWRNNTAHLPSENLVVKQHRAGAVDVSVGERANLKMRLENLDIDRMFSEYARGFEDLVQLAVERDLNVLIAFDSDHRGRFAGNSITLDVQRAAARLGLELRTLRLPLTKVKQLVLPLGNHEKMGLDDFLVEYSSSQLQELIDAALSNPRQFPAHPNIYSHVTRKLQYSKATRKDIGNLGITIISDLDARGKRLRSDPDNDLYYFDDKSKTLMQVTSAALKQSSGGGPLLYDEFKNLLYQDYGLLAIDHRVMATLSTQISSESPIDKVKARKGTFALGDTIHHQINSRQYITISGDSPVELHNNGDNGIMFESKAVDDTVDGTQLVNEINRLSSHKLEPWWYDTLQRTRIKDTAEDRQKQLATLLFYASPWLFRWRNTQLPVELITGEAGSGKSTLYSMRLQILTGRQDLRNRPQSLKDWHASVLDTGGLHVIDNANLDSDPSLGQSISDEMCRLVTEPNPTIEMRRYYTEKGLIRVPAHVVFAMTSVKLPFRQLDLMQRAFHIQLERGTSGDSYMFDTDWAENQLRERGGRISWLAHHILVIHKFLRIAARKWDPGYRAKYRLINFEQISKIMAEVFDWDPEWIPSYLSSATKEATVKVDWLLQGLQAYGLYLRNKGESSYQITFPATAITNWAMDDDEFSGCKALHIPNSVSRYILGNPSLVAATAGIEPAGVNNGKQVFKLTKR
jgi:hypothetical protein